MENRIIHGDALTELKQMPDGSINCVVTSPPYFNLRDYGVNGQIGLEKSYKDYINNLIKIFNEVKRILKKEGTCFVNLGDTYSGSGGDHKEHHNNNSGFQGEYGVKHGSPGVKAKEITAKSLMLIPHRFAINMIDNGWILRNTIVWIKKNAMPESVRDRWKKAHEYIFFFTKNNKYYFDLDSIRTPHKEISVKRAEYELGRNALGMNPSSIGEKYNRDKKNRDGTEKYYSMPARQMKLNPKGAVPPDFLEVMTNCKNKDTVQEHYATYPMDLVYPLIKAGCPKGGTVLDPFAGSCTTAVVAKQLKRKWIMIELNPKYCKIGEQRIKSQPEPML